MDGQVTWSDLGISCGKTWSEPLVATKEKTSQPCSKRSSKSSSRKPPVLKCLKRVGLPGGGTTMRWEDDGAWCGELTTRNTGECPNAVVVSRLSQILEETPHPKYNLTAKACQGILRRAERRGKDLPKLLKAVLIRQSGDCMTAWDCQSKRIFDTNGKSPTLQGGVGGGVNNPAIFAAIPINDKATRWQGGGESRNHDGSGNGLGIGKEGDPSPTLTAGDRHGVAVALDMTHACDVIRECGEQVPALQARMGTGGNQVPLTYGIGNGQVCEASIMAEEVSQTLNTMHDAQAVMCEDVSHALRAKANCAYREDAETYPVQNMVVRRLTPLECTRLQGYPDGWVDIGDWTDEKGKKHKDADSPKYKALGNSIALPFWDWMLRRMARYLPEGATLGSLFDGISGFNVCWARIHGAEHCRWSSEIEQFPIAVTKKHFGDEKSGETGDWEIFSGGMTW